MGRLVFCVIAAMISMLAPSTGAPAPDPRAVARKGLVSVLTDGITDPDGRTARMINQLAAYASRLRNVRVMPVSGHGGTANVRDLLYLRGIDFAVVNADILSFLDLTGQYPEARRRLRYVTHLYDQKVFLLARNEIKAIEDLRGRKVVVLSEDGPGRVTAQALFGMRKIDVTIEDAGAGVTLDDAGLSRFDGALLLGDEFARLRLSARAREEYHLLPIRMMPALQRAYRSAVIDVPEAAGFSNAKIQTVTVSALLATFNWTPTQTRYADVTNFISALFSNLKALRQLPGSNWRQADVLAKIPGWRRFSAVLPNRVLTPAQLAELTVVERPVAAPAPAAGPGPAPYQRTRRLKVLAVERPPLADPHQPDGGVIAALLNASLRIADQRNAGRSEIDVTWSTAPPTIALLENESTIDLSLPWESADCDDPDDLAQSSAMLCDDVLYSDPVLQLVIGLFTLSDSGFDFTTDESIFGKSICVPLDRDLSVLNGPGRRWLSEKRIDLIRRSTLLDCISLVQQHQADAFIASDLEGRYALRQLGLSQLFKMMERPVGTRGVHVIVPKDRPQAEDLIDAVNQGIRQLKRSDAYAPIIRQHLMKLWGIQASAP